MGDVVNLNKYRKQREKERGKETARENRVKYGRSSAEKKLSRTKRELEDKRLEHHKCDLLPMPDTAKDKNTD